MFGIVLLAVGMMLLGVYGLCLGDSSDKFLKGLLIIMGGLIFGLGMSVSSAPQFNKPLKPVRLRTNDTLFVAPKDGDQGVALIVKADSTGQRVIEFRSFIAEHKIAPVIK